MRSAYNMMLHMYVSISGVMCVYVKIEHVCINEDRRNNFNENYGIVSTHD